MASVAEPMDEAALTGPSLAPPADDTAQAGGGGGLFGASGDRLGIAEDARLPRVWVDTRELQVRRIDRSDGVFTIFGPIVSFEKVLVPAWFEVHEPGAETVRFEIDRAVAVNAPPTAFSRKWLFAPVEPAPGGPAPASAPAPAPARPGPGR